MAELLPFQVCSHVRFAPATQSSLLCVLLTAPLIQTWTEEPEGTRPMCLIRTDVHREGGGVAGRDLPKATGEGSPASVHHITSTSPSGFPICQGSGKEGSQTTLQIARALYPNRNLSAKQWAGLQACPSPPASWVHCPSGHMPGPCPKIPPEAPP